MAEPGNMTSTSSIVDTTAVDSLLSADFLDDYFAESDEHLSAIRRALLALEGSAETAQTDLVLGELFRCFHSLKGISGMVGLAAAEQLAHEMENYLRYLRQGQVTLTSRGMDDLASGIQTLEHVIGAFKAGKTGPDITSAMLRLGQLSTTQTAADDAHTLAVTSKRELSPTEGQTVAGHIVRVDLSRLDVLMRIVGEMVIGRARLEEELKRSEAFLPVKHWRGLQESNQNLARQLRDLREGIVRVRLVSIGEIFERMPFVVRDITRDSPVKARVEISGWDTEVDKYLVERMMDPLLHLVRNAVSHGLEPSVERVAAGKPEEGRVMLRAATVGEMIEIQIEDDGRGIDAEHVLEHARARGLHIPAAKLDTALLLDLICMPGFSTRLEADRVSGRGIGMDVVHNTINELGGSLDIATKIGRGTTFTVRLPLTLTITDALIVSVGEQRYAVPNTVIQEVMEVHPAAIKAVKDSEVIIHRNVVLPLLRLARLFKLSGRQQPTLHGLVVTSGPMVLALAVDRIIGLREVVVHTLADPLIKTPGIGGATELGDGSAVLILDVATLSKLILQRRAYETTLMIPQATSVNI